MTYFRGWFDIQKRGVHLLCDYVFIQVKSLGKPPYGVKLTMEATCIMFGIKPDKINDPDNPGKKVSSSESLRDTLLFLQFLFVLCNRKYTRVTCDAAYNFFYGKWNVNLGYG